MPVDPEDAMKICKKCFRSAFIDFYFTCCIAIGKSSESVQCAMLKACDACADMGQV